MAERIPDPSTWLFRPSEGLVRKWVERNQDRPAFRELKVLDTAVVLEDFFRDWDGSSNTRYGKEDISLIVNGPDVPAKDTEAYRIWQEYAHSPEADPNNGAKMHLHSYEFTPDGKLALVGSNFDWHRMVSLGQALGKGELDEHYRDELLPARIENTVIFDSEHPNNTNSHSIVITSDKHIVLATRGQNVSYSAGYTAATVEQQTNPELENHPFDTFLAAVSKYNGMRLNNKSELNLTVQPESLRLGGIFLEADVNCAAFLVVGQVEEESSQITANIIGESRAKEFSPEPNSVWTLSLTKPDELVRQFYNPRGFLWHPTARLRIIAALSYVHGYEQALDLFYRGYLAA